MADRQMTTVAQGGQLRPQEAGVNIHPVMALIGALWANFGAGKSTAQKVQMIKSWEDALADIPVGLQVEAVRRKAKAGQVWPPSSPAEIRQWCNEIQPPMTSLDRLWYQTCLDEGLLPPDFCRRQIAKYETAQEAGRVCYAGWD